MKLREVVQLDLGAHKLSEFTDGGSADGTKTISTKLPAGFFPLVFSADVETAAVKSGATCITLLAGVSGDTDAFLASVSLASGSVLLAGVPTAPATGLNAASGTSILLTASVAGSGVVFSGTTGGEFTLMAGGIFVNREEQSYP